MVWWVDWSPGGRRAVCLPKPLLPSLRIGGRRDPPLTNNNNNNKHAPANKCMHHATDRRAGDGTTTSIIMTQAIVNQGVKYVKSGMNPVSLREGILAASKAVCDRIPELARKVQSVEDLVNIATVSTGGATEMAQTIAKVFERVGMDAKVCDACILSCLHGSGTCPIPWGRVVGERR